MQMLDISVARLKFNRMNQHFRDTKTKVLYVARHGKPAFAVVDCEYLEALIETIDILGNPESMKLLQEAIEDIKAGRTHNHEDVKNELLS